MLKGLEFIKGKWICRFGRYLMYSLIHQWGSVPVRAERPEWGSDQPCSPQPGRITPTTCLRTNFAISRRLPQCVRNFQPGIRYEDFGNATLSALLQSYPKEIETMVTPDGVKMRLRTQLSLRQIMAIRRKPPVRPGRDRKGTDKSC